MYNLSVKILVFILIGFSSFSFAQKDVEDLNEKNRVEEIKKELVNASKRIKGLNQPVDISVNNYTIQEIVRAIAQEHNLNVSVDPTLNASPSYNFTGATVMDVFVFLCKEHKLTIDWTGDIMAFRKIELPKVELNTKKPKVIDLRYNVNDSLVNADLVNDTLYNVVRLLSKLSQINIGLAPEIHNELVTMTIVNQSIPAVIERLSHDKIWRKISNEYYFISSQKSEDSKILSNDSKLANKNNQKTSSNKTTSNAEPGKLGIQVSKDSLVSFSAIDFPIKDIIKELSMELGVDYFLLKEPTKNITLNITNQKYDDVLGFLLNSSEFTYKKINNVYIIGERKEENLRNTKLIRLQYRTTDLVMEVIPAELKKNVEVKEFKELNAFLLSGSELQITELENFFKLIDQTVPVVLIEVFIVDVKKNYNYNSGVKIGRQEGVQSGASVGTTSNTAGLDVTLNDNLLNRISQSLSSFGWINLGNVGSDFYFQMNALETQGAIKLKSTPKLATLNGHEAKMSIGETRYFSQEQTNIVGAQTPQTVKTVTYTPVNADLALSIKPRVSGDDLVTIDVTVSQSNFTRTTQNLAPPEFEKKEFHSVIRLKNQEMVILGGLEQNRNDRSNSGVPILARIPVIKWFFSNTEVDKSQSQLTIFIRPTIIY